MSDFPGVDLARLAEWMDAEGLPRGPIEAPELLGGGTQNVLLRFRRGGEDYVLRRPPVHKRANSDETMRREARVLGALAGSDVPHPRLLAACAAEDVLGASFYLMEPIEGFHAPTGLPELHAGDAKVRHAMGLAMVDGIAALGRVDHEAVGLGDFGKPEGWLERQVPRWRGQLESYSALEGYPGPQIPGVDAVGDWLDRHRPSSFRAGILHGDFHVANVLFRHDGPALAAIVDWELCTVADPLLDLGWLLATTAGLVAIPDLPEHGELVAHYAAQSDRDLSGIAWYEVLACYKLGIILEGTHARACAGKAPKATGDALHATTLALFERASQRIAEN